MEKYLHSSNESAKKSIKKATEASLDFKELFHRGRRITED